jgi:hypothetical protein
MTALASDRPVRHPRHGEGRVVTDLGDTVIVRFGATLEQVERGELEVVRSLADALTEGVLDDPLAVLARAQALLIRSINDQWGVFSRSRVQLLPHQLWVCRQVTQRWPARWLVADDVGLGKTIEAGLILTPLMAGGRIRRLLILAPARLVPQWRARLKSMFDIRLNAYTREQDRGKISFSKHEGALAFRCQVLHLDRRDRLHIEEWRRTQAAVAGQHRVVLVDHDRCQPAELAHAGGDHLDLAVAVAAGIAAVDFEILGGAVLDYRCEGLGHVLKAGLTRSRLAHYRLVDLVLVGGLGRCALGFLDHIPTSSRSRLGAHSGCRRKKVERRHLSGGTGLMSATVADEAIIRETGQPRWFAGAATKSASYVCRGTYA